MVTNNVILGVFNSIYSLDRILSILLYPSISLLLIPMTLAFLIRIIFSFKRKSREHKTIYVEINSIMYFTKKININIFLKLIIITTVIYGFLLLLIPYFINEFRPLGTDAPRYMYRLLLVEKYNELLLFGGKLAPGEWEYLSIFLSFLPVYPLRFAGFSLEEIWIIYHFVLALFYLLSLYRLASKIFNDRKIVFLLIIISITSTKIHILSLTLYRNLLSLALINLLLSIIIDDIKLCVKNNKIFRPLLILAIGLYIVLMYPFHLIILIPIMLYYIINKYGYKVNLYKNLLIIVIAIFALVFVFLGRSIISNISVFFTGGTSYSAISLRIHIENMLPSIWYKMYSTNWNKTFMENTPYVFFMIIGIIYVIFRFIRDRHDISSEVIFLWTYSVLLSLLFLERIYAGPRLLFNMPTEFLTFYGLNQVCLSLFNVFSNRNKIKIFTKILILRAKLVFLFIIVLSMLFSYALVITSMNVLNSPVSRPYVTNDYVSFQLDYIRENIILKNINKKYIFLVDERFSRGEFYDYLAWTMYKLKVRVLNVDIYIGSLFDLVQNKSSVEIIDYPLIWNGTIGNRPKYQIDSNTVIITIMTNNFSYYIPSSKEVSCFKNFMFDIYIVDKECIMGYKHGCR